MAMIEVVGRTERNVYKRVRALVNPRSRFYSGKVVLITWQQWLIYIGLACSGMASYASLISALYLRVPPTTVAALRTLQIVLAFIAQVIY